MSRLWNFAGYQDDTLLLAIALSMPGALAFGEPLAGLVVVLIYAEGQLLETAAARRAQQEMWALLGRAARTARRHADTSVAELPNTENMPGAPLLLRQITPRSVFVGLGLSIPAMVAAATGFLPPVQGSLLQEAIDVVVVHHALRARR